MAVNVSIDSLLDSMVAQLAAQMAPSPGGFVSPLRPVRSVGRYTGSELTTEEGFKRGMAGRTPALRVRHAGSRTIRTTIGRRVDRVESSFSVVVCSDSQRGKEDRENLLALAESVRRLVGARAFSKAVQPMRWANTKTMIDNDQLLALAVTFTTKHRVDYTIDPGTDVMESAGGTGDEIFDGSPTAATPPRKEAIHITFPETP